MKEIGLYRLASKALAFVLLLSLLWTNVGFNYFPHTQVIADMYDLLDAEGESENQESEEKVVDLLFQYFLVSSSTFIPKKFNILSGITRIQSIHFLEIQTPPPKLFFTHILNDDSKLTFCL